MNIYLIMRQYVSDGGDAEVAYYVDTKEEAKKVTSDLRLQKTGYDYWYEVVEKYIG